MAKKNAPNAYRRLIGLMVITLVLLIVAVTGIVLLNRFSQDQLDEKKAAVQAQNDQLIAQYNEAMQEYTAAQQSGKDQTWPSVDGIGWEVSDLSQFGLTSSTPISVTRKELLLGGLMLVNRWCPIPADFSEEEIVTIYSLTDRETVPCSSGNVNSFPVVISALKDMLTAAKAEGLENFLIDEGYRSQTAQTEYFNKEADKYRDRYTGDALIEKVRESVSYPNTSDYQSGFSVRILRYKSGDAEFNKASTFATSEHSIWLQEHAWEYGFVFRFPVAGYPLPGVVDKSFKTGISLKLSVYRYVGKPHAAAMTALNLCLEEYIEYLMAHPHIAVYEDGVLRYEITRVAGGNTAAPFTAYINPNCRDYSISTDNAGGVVVGMTY